jgi:predicted DNA-binding transcriptional regulator YafY
MMGVQSEQRSSIDELADALDVSRRTLFRDLRALQDAGIPCYFDRRRQIYKIDNGFFMPPANLTPEEAFGLLLFVRNADRMLDLPYGEDARRAILKIESNLPANVREYCKQRLRDVSVHRARPKTRASIDKRFKFLQEAIRQRRILEMTYNSKSDPAAITCKFSPFHLVYTNCWYVMGKLEPRGTIQSIKFSDIQRMEPTSKCFVGEDPFDPTDHLGRAWSTVPEGKLYQVRLKFAPEIVPDVTAVEWHNTQHTTIEKDGSALVEFRVDGLSEISWWVVGFGDKVEVLAPVTLRQRIHEIAASMAKRNEARDVNPRVEKASTSNT